MARCRHDLGLRTSLAKSIEGQMSIVTKLPGVSAQSRAFISGRSKSTWHGDLYTQTGAGGNGGKNVGGKTGGCVCFYIIIIIII